MVECDICGREFDTERGMKSHRRQSHSPADDLLRSADSNVNFSLKVNHALLLAFVVGIFTGGFMMAAIGGGVQGALVQDPGSNNPTDTGNNDPSGSGTGDISVEGEPVLGSADAPVTIVAYEDFECPFCQRFEQNAGEQIVQNYVESGQARLVWKDFPLTQIHPWADPAAAAMECVYREGGNDAFWAVKDKIFSNHNSISTSNVESKIKAWAAEEGVSESAVQSCLENGNPMEEVNQDKREGANNGVSGTPTIFINGQKIVGAQPYSAFRSVIESQLG